MELKEIIKKHLSQLKEQKTENYMFFSNLQQIKRQCELLLELDPNMIEEVLQNGHDWADDHVTVAKENIDQVLDFFMNKENEGDLNEDGKMQSGEEDPCWDGYEMVGKKIKNGKEVPNCVPKK